MFKALFLNTFHDTVTTEIRTLAEADLPEGEVRIDVLYSSINYKDALAVTGRGKIIRGAFPFIPGIDLVGRVAASSVPAFKPGDLVLQTGDGLGEHRWGGYSQQQRLPARSLIALPNGMTALEAMELGTAGFTAMLSVMALEAHDVTPDRGAVVVTGASGGVGSIAVALLARLGYEVVASSGSEEAYAYLEALGATRILPREELGQGPTRPLMSARWAGAVDTVGGDTLASVLSTLGWHGCVASCGNAGGHQLNTTVFPFILRGVNLLGIDSNTPLHEVRRAAWNRLAGGLSDQALDLILGGVIPLDQVPERCRTILAGNVRGRIVVDVNG